MGTNMKPNKLNISDIHSDDFKNLVYVCSGEDSWKLGLGIYQTYHKSILNTHTAVLISLCHMDMFNIIIDAFDSNGNIITTGEETDIEYHHSWNKFFKLWNGDHYSVIYHNVEQKYFKTGMPDFEFNGIKGGKALTDDIIKMYIDESIKYLKDKKI